MACVVCLSKKVPVTSVGVKIAENLAFTNMLNELADFDVGILLKTCFPLPMRFSI